MDQAPGITVVFTPLDWVWVVLLITVMIACGVIFYRLGKRSGRRRVPLPHRPHRPGCVRADERSWEKVSDDPADPTNNVTERIIGLTFKIRAKTTRGFKSQQKVLAHP